MGFMSFVESFVIKAFQKDPSTIANPPMLIDPQAMFVMCSLCYAQCPSYLLCTIFMSTCILQHCTKLDSCTMATLEKLFTLGSFDIMVGHLAFC